MLTDLFFTKLAAVLTVIYAGMNLHQLTSSHAYLTGKIEEFRLALAESETAPRLIRLNLVFYAAIPLVYLIVLRVAAVADWALILLAAKFAFTAAMDIHAERRILAGEDYTPMRHAVSRMDNVANLAAAAGVVYLLFKPAGPLP